MGNKIFKTKRIYYNPEKNQNCLVYYIGGKHSCLNISKLVCEHYLDWEYGGEYTVEENLSEIPSSWEKVGFLSREGTIRDLDEDVDGTYKKKRDFEKKKKLERQKKREKSKMKKKKESESNLSQSMKDILDMKESILKPMDSPYAKKDISIPIPVLNWPVFTPSCTSVESVVHELELTYKISFSGKDNEGNWMFSVMCEHKKGQYSLAQNTDWRNAQIFAQRDYEEKAWEFLAVKSNFFTMSRTSEKALEND